MKSFTVILFACISILVNSKVVFAQDTPKSANEETTGSFNDVEDKMNNPDLENTILLQMQDIAQKRGWGETFTQVKITAEDWTVLHNNVTGAILERVIGAALKATWPDGHCTCQIFVLKEQYNGNSFENSVSLYSTGQQTRIDCN